MFKASKPLKLIEIQIYIHSSGRSLIIPYDSITRIRELYIHQVYIFRCTKRMLTYTYAEKKRVRNSVSEI